MLKNLDGAVSALSLFEVRRLRRFHDSGDGSDIAA
jgi:hypothetical protein